MPALQLGESGHFTLLAPPCRSPTLNHLHQATLTKDIVRAAMDDEGIIASLLDALEQAYLARPHRADGHGHDLSRQFPQSGDWERDFENLKEHVAMKTKLYPLLDG
jgi:hypothetical protein